MTTAWFDWYFLTGYGVVVLVVLLKIFFTPSALGGGAAKTTARGGGWLLPGILLSIEYVVPLAVIATHAGAIARTWWALRFVGFALSLYAGATMTWTSAVMGRYLVPRTVVFEGHQLVTSGPFRYLRHPAYSAGIALWLGAALGTLNVVLGALLPLIAVGYYVQARSEERLLEDAFGDAYRALARSRRRFVPGLF